MREFKLAFSELANLYVKVVRGDTSMLNRRANINQAKEEAEYWKTPDTFYREFYGVTSEEMITYLTHGYRVPGLNLSPSLTPVRTRRRMKLSDLDGDFQYDLWKSGEDLFFVDFTPRENVPSIAFRFSVNFASTMDESTIRHYQSWLLKAILALENSGVNCSISANLYSLDLLGGKHPCSIDIEVKRAGERADFAVWSAMFAPVCYRHLGFLSYILASDHHGFDVHKALGTVPETTDFYCEWQEETKTLIAHCAARGNPRFNEEAMTESFRKALDSAMNN